jgi:proline iminopeptidase
VGGGLYPDLTVFETGMLDTGDGNLIYWETSGNPKGKPALVVHGGPGSGSSPSLRRFFDPEKYLIIQFDQRGCGRSSPHASDPNTDLTTNTTAHLLGDMELLRDRVEVERWLLFGLSWGSTLALAYAELHPELVTEIILAAVTTTRHSEIDWLYHGSGRFLPEEWDRFRDGAGVDDPDADLVRAYRTMLNDPDPNIRERAAIRWCDWEDAVVSTTSNAEPNPRYADPVFRMGFARLVTHYFSNAAWLEDGQLLAHADRLRNIPGKLVHGRLDVSSPLETAWQLSVAWPKADLVVVEGAGHSANDQGMTEALVAATNQFATHH